MTDAFPTLSPKEALILDLLADAGETYGLGLVEASRGRLGRGTVYVTLGRMEDKGYVLSRQEEKKAGTIGLPRRMYRATPMGLRVREAWALVKATLAWEAT
jgi:DNA-binding PadR family transcriptional regulator